MSLCPSSCLSVDSLTFFNREGFQMTTSLVWRVELLFVWRRPVLVELDKTFNSSTPQVPGSNPSRAVVPLAKALYPHCLVSREGLKAIGPLVTCLKATCLLRARSYMFSVQIPGAFVLGTCSRNMFSVHMRFRLRDQWIVLGTIAFRFVIGTIRGLRSLTSMHYTAQPENLSLNDWQADLGSWRALAAAVC